MRSGATCVFLQKCRICRLLLLLSCPSHNLFPHFRAHALSRSVTVARSSAGQVSSSRQTAGEEVNHRLWLPAVAIHRLSVVKIAPSPHHCFRTAHPCVQSVKGSPTEPLLSRSSRQRLGYLQSHFDGGWHVCPADFPELQSAAACRRVERRDGRMKLFRDFNLLAGGW